MKPSYRRQFSIHRPVRLRRYGLFTLLVFFILPLPLLAQTDETTPQLELRLNRDFGLGVGSLMQGTFSLSVDGPADLQQVQFLIDDAIIRVDEDPPFQTQFRTGSYAAGTHIMQAVGETEDGRILRSNVIRRQFISRAAAGRVTLWIIVPIILLVLGGRFLSNRLANRDGTQEVAVSGPLGGTICPHCERPYAYHLWSINLVLARIDRCPHCGRWAATRRASPDRLAEAAADALEQDPPDRPKTDGDEASDDDWRRRLDDSRYRNN